MKYVFLDTKYTTVIIMSNSNNSGSFTTKSILIVFYLVFRRIASEVSFLSSN